MIEIVVYSTLFAIIIGAVVYTLIALGGAYRALQSTQAISTSAQVALERMTREIRAASSVDIGASTLASSPGVLRLNTYDDLGVATTIEFSVQSDVLHVSEGGVDQGPLTQETAHVSNLIFRRITTAKSEAVKVDMTLECGEGASFASKKFYSTIVLRGSYPVN